MDDLVRLLDLMAGASKGASSGRGHEQFPDGSQSDPPLAVATVVNTRGSVYRRPGARMLIRRSMAVSGAVSAGCLERDIIANCEGLAEDDRPLLLSYDGSSPDELVFGLKLGCDGIVQVLLEPIGQAGAGKFDNNNFDNKKTAGPGKYESLGRLLPSLLEQHRRLVAVTLFDLAPVTEAGRHPDSISASPEGGDGQRIDTFYPGGRGLVLLDTGSEIHELEPLPEPVSRLLVREARSAVLDNSCRSCVVMEQAGEWLVSALIEVVEPITSILIFGSGQDVEPLVKMTAVLGWHSTVFSAAQVNKQDAAQLASAVVTSHFNAAVVMSHDYEIDKKILQALFNEGGRAEAGAPLPYIGVVGPRRRSEKLLAELALAGIPITEEQLSRFFSPVGLDIGAERPEEIALSILAEIKAVLAGHRGGLLREKQGPIHEPMQIKALENADIEAAGQSISLSCRLDNV